MNLKQRLIKNLEGLLNAAIAADDSLESQAELAYSLQVVEHDYVSSVQNLIENNERKLIAA